MEAKMVSREKIMKFIEFGIGNRWLVRTETELQDGTEFEQKGIVKPIPGIQTLWTSCEKSVWLRKRAVALTKSSQIC